MIISICIPNMNRTYDLKQTLPKTIQAINNSPPAEIVVLDYDSKDDLEEYIKTTKDTVFLEEGNTLLYTKSPNHPYFSISHSRNLAALASHGEYIIILDADISPHEDFINYIRELIEKENPIWMCEKGLTIEGFTAGRIPVVKRDEFISAGGYDERFNVCGPEDKDICMRLHRRGGKFIAFPHSLTDEIYTPRKEKIRNLNLELYKDELPKGKGWTKLVMSRTMRKIYEENNANKALVANEGKEWGKW